MKNRTDRAIWKSACYVARAGIRTDPRRWLMPLDYARTRELPAVLDLIKHERLRNPSCRVLDVASPQMLSVHLALSNPKWEFVYLNQFKPELDLMRRMSTATQLSNISVFEGDVRNHQTFAAHSYDLILCSSVLEHIHDKDGLMGDSIAINNIAKWLKPDGQAVISVPYSRCRFDEFTEQPVYGDHPADSRCSNKVFFQRFYDDDSLRSRIVLPSGLRIDARMFLGERRFYENNPHRRMAGLLADSGFEILLGRVFPLLSKVFMEEAYDDSLLKKPYIAVINLSKA